MKNCNGNCQYKNNDARPGCSLFYGTVFDVRSLAGQTLPAARRMIGGWSEFLSRSYLESCEALYYRTQNWISLGIVSTRNTYTARSQTSRSQFHNCYSSKLAVGMGGQTHWLLLIECPLLVVAMCHVYCMPRRVALWVMCWAFSRAVTTTLPEDSLSVYTFNKTLWHTAYREHIYLFSHFRSEPPNPV